MSVQIHDVEQGTDAWFQVRAGVPTASEFAAIMSKGRGAQPSKLRLTYMLKLAGEIITGRPTESFSTAAMERGHALEDEARRLYAFMTDEEPEQVGFVTNGSAGCSPDALIGKDGGLEIKTKTPHLLIHALLNDEMPDEHKPQVQGGMWVCQREWWDFGGYMPGLPMLTKRIYRDEKYIAELAAAVSAFNDELAEVVAKIRAMGGSEAA